jgi:hypothetical protein
MSQTGRGMCGSRRDAHLSFRRPDLRLAQEGTRRRRHTDRRRSRSGFGHTYLQLLQKFNYKTQVMGASFRKVGQIIRLAGCDLLTISPDLLEKMQQTQGEVTPALTPEKAKSSEGKRLQLDEKTFRWMHNEDAMAVDKLSEGIRKFYADARKLEQYARSQVREKVGA